MPCVRYVGVKDDGKFEERLVDFDSVHKTINRMLQSLYPRAAYFPKLLSEGDKQALAIIVPGSELLPHFSGPAYVRRGSESFEASEQEFARLVAMRNNKSYYLLQHIGMPVSVTIQTVL